MWVKNMCLARQRTFEVSAQHISKDQRVFVDSCHVNRSQDPNYMPCQDVIRNFGWVHR